MKEVWKDIKDYEGLYQVSNLGRIKSVNRKFIGKDGIKKTVNEKILAIGKDKITQRHPRPHCTVELWKDNKRKRIRVHRLVAEAFIPNLNGKPQVNHIDGNPLNNEVSNLEWVTNSENLKHAYEHELRGKHNTKPIVAINKITNEKIVFESVADASKYFNVTPGAIRAPLKGYGRSKSCCGYIIQYK